MLRSPVLNLMKPVVSASNIEEVLEAIGGNFDVELRPNYFPTVDGKMKENPRSKNIVRTDIEVALGTGSNGYGVVQYRHALEYLNSLITTNTAKFHAAALTDNGARLHVIMKANEYVEIASGELVDFYFYVATSHDQTASVVSMVTPVHNLSQTVFTPLDNGTVRFKHSRHVNKNMQKAANTFAMMNKEWKSVTDHFTLFSQTKLDDKKMQVYFTMINPGDTAQAENTRNKLIDIFKTGMLSSLDSCKDTLWGAFMAVQQYADFYQTVKRSRTGRSENEARIEGRLSGAGARQKAHAYAMGLKFASMSNL